MLTFISKAPHLYRQALATFVSSLLGVSAGFVFGITSILLPQLREDHSFPYDQKYDSWLASMTALSQIIGGIATGTILDAFGRKFGHIILISPYVIGWLLMAFASNISLMFAGRFINSVATGGFGLTFLVYIGEIVEPKYRSIALLFSTVTMNTGILFVHVVGSYLYWRTNLLVCMAPLVPVAVLILFIKESPLWLISKGRIDEGITAFKWFRDDCEESDKELQMVLEKRQEKPEVLSVRDVFKVLLSKSFVMPFIILIFMNVSVQFCGISSLIFYAQDIFQSTYSGEIDAFLLMIWVDVIRLIVSIILCVLAKNMPRRLIFLIFSFTTALGLVGIILFQFIEPLKIIWMSVLSMIVFFISGNVIIIVYWPIIPEILPNNVRGFGSGLIMTISNLFLFITLKTAPDIIITNGPIMLYASFVIVTFLSACVLYFILPETNGISLQEIENQFSRQKVQPSNLTMSSFN